MVRSKNPKAYVICISLILFMTVIPLQGLETTSGHEIVLQNDPIEISTVEELQAMRDDLSADYVLVNDIDASETREWNDGKGFEPVGCEDSPFIGNFDGRNHTISGLYINRTDSSYGGMFGYVGEEGLIRDVGLIDADLSGEVNVGILVGWNEGTVSNSYATGTVSGYRYVGGLAGTNPLGTVLNSYTIGDVSGDRRVGGLTGFSSGTMTNSYAIGNVSGEVDVGGLVGYNDWGTLSNSYAMGNVSGGRNVGGLVGTNSGTVNNSCATSKVSGDKWYAGGLVGWNSDTVQNSYATGSVSGTSRVGGLVGSISNIGVVENSYATGNVSGDEIAGGLVGKNWGLVENSYATGNITRKADATSTEIGGFVGRNLRGKIINCYSTGSVHYEDAEDPTDKGFAGSVDTSDDYNMTGNFWNVETSGQNDTAGDATGLNTTEMQTNETFIEAGWDFENIWIIDDERNDRYPYLQWQEFEEEKEEEEENRRPIFLVSVTLVIFIAMILYMVIASVKYG